jgi:hypothetical protein
MVNQEVEWTEYSPDGPPCSNHSVFTDMSLALKCVERAIKRCEGDFEFNPPANDDGTFTVEAPK